MLEEGPIEGPSEVVDEKMTDPTEIPFLPHHKRLIIVGNYGSGKTEVAVNLALAIRAAGNAVTIADLDVVNPYFRCRERSALMENQGIRVVIPPGEKRFADLPIVVPEIKGMLEDDTPKRPYALFDVGGDDVGARLLSSMRDALEERPYSLWQVINARRPFTSTVAGCLKMMRAIEATSRMTVTGLVVNTHLMEHTTASVILEGYELARKVEEASGVPIAFVTAMAPLADAAELNDIESYVLSMKRRMLPPWLDGNEWSTREQGPRRMLGEIPAALRFDL
jgi:hypothetical protein